MQGTTTLIYTKTEAVYTEKNDIFTQKIVFSWKTHSKNLQTNIL